MKITPNILIKDAIALISRPKVFFERWYQDPPSLAYAVTFALLARTLGALLQFFWQASLAELAQPWIQRVFHAFDTVVSVDSYTKSGEISDYLQKVYVWFFSATAVILEPFKAGVALLFGSLWVWIMVRLLVDPNRLVRLRFLDFSFVFMLYCFSCVSDVFKGIPFLGAAFVLIFQVNILWHGSQVLFRTSRAKSAFIALSPQILWIISIFAALLTLGYLLVQGFLLLFGTAF